MLHVPRLGAYKDLDGYTERWVELWDEYKQEGSASGPLAAAFGYAIETLATIVYLPPAPAGLAIELQGPRGGTRPDVILKRGSDDVAWLDITSEGSGLHVLWGKVGWGGGQVHEAEFAYPPMQLEDFQPTENYSDDIDMSEFQKRIFWARTLMAIRREAWRLLGKRFQPQRRRGEDPLLRQARLRLEICTRITEYFKQAVDEPTAASVLYAMGVNPKTHGIDRSASRARGESFLLQYDPNLPTIEIPEEGVPRLIPQSEEYLAFLRRALERGELEEGAIPDQLEPGTESAEGLGEGVGTEELGMEFEADRPGEPGQQPGQVVRWEGAADAGGLALQPVASYEFVVTGLPQVSPAVLTGVGDLLQQHQLSLLLTLSYGPVQTTFFASPGPTFAAALQEGLQAYLASVRARESEEGEEEGARTRGRDRRLTRPPSWKLRFSLLRHAPYPAAALEGPPGGLPRRQNRPALLPPTFPALLAELFSNLAAHESPGTMQIGFGEQ